MSSRSSPRQKHWKISPVSVLAMLAVMVSLLFAAGGGQMGKGILFVLGGLGMALYPPKQSLPKYWKIAAVGMLALCLYVFIPGLAFLSGEWREEMGQIYGINPSTCLTAQPWITLDHSLFLLFGVSLFYCWSLQAPDARVRRQILRFFALWMVFFSVLVLIVYYGKFSLPGWNSPRNLGPFENRNQLSGILAVSLLILLALFSNDINKHRIWATVWVLAAALEFYLLVLNYSRAGVVLLFLGGLAWLFLNFQTGHRVGRVVFVFLMLAILLSVFFIFGGETLGRFDQSGTGAEFAGTARLAIQQDALSLVKSQPLAGVGLGNFDEVFPQYRNIFQSDSFVRHPESDWLWLTAETGILGLLTFLFLGGVWLRGVLPLKSGTDKHFRSICLVAVLVVLVHGLVDVPFHRTGVAIPVIFLASLALPALGGVPAAAWVRRAWSIFGALALLWGVGILLETAGVWSKPGEGRVRNIEEKLSGLWVENKEQEGLTLINTALESAPLRWELYYWRASLLLKSGDLAGARDDFRRARFFEKTSAVLAMNESLQWLPVRPDLALSAANEMLQRSRYATEVRYWTIASEAKRVGNEEFLGQLRLLARSYPELKHYYLETAPDEEFDRWFNDDEQNFRDREAYWFWPLIRQRKSTDDLLNWAQAQPDRMRVLYPHLAGILAEKKEWERAFLLMKNHMPKAQLPELNRSETFQDEARKNLMLHPHDFAFANQVVQEEIAGGHFAAAQERISSLLTDKTAPAYFHYLASLAYEGLQEWEKAFQSISRYNELRARQ